MRLGIKRIEHIDSLDIYDYSQVRPNGSLDLSAYIREGCSLEELPFTPETAQLQERWTRDSGGKLSKFTFNAAIRADRESFRDTLQKLVGRKHIWRITLVSGKVYVVGSREFVPAFSFDDGVSGISSSEFNISIENDSVHGVLFDTGDGIGPQVP